MTKAAQQQKEESRQLSIESLKMLLVPGSTIYTNLMGVSSSGISRTIKLLIPAIDIQGTQKIVDISWDAANVLGLKMNNDNSGIKISGVGMDMGFNLVYELGRSLWPNGDGKYTKNRNGNKGPETDGGYCLNQKWI